MAPLAAESSGRLVEADNGGMVGGEEVVSLSVLPLQKGLRRAVTVSPAPSIGRRSMGTVPGISFAGEMTDDWPVLIWISSTPV